MQSAYGASRHSGSADRSIRRFSDGDTAGVIALWKVCGLTRPWNDPRLDIERRQAIRDGLFLLATIRMANGSGGVPAGAADEDTIKDTTKPSGQVPDAANGPGERIVGSAMGGYDGHRGWVYYVAVHPHEQGAGVARELMSELERRLIARGCPKINLQVRDDNDAAIAFYRHLGYAVDATTSLGKRLISDEIVSPLPKQEDRR